MARGSAWLRQFCKAARDPLCSNLRAESPLPGVWNGGVLIPEPSVPIVRPMIPPRHPTVSLLPSFYTVRVPTRGTPGFAEALQATLQWWRG